MHTFWFVLLTPLFLIAANLTVKKLSVINPQLASDSATTIWWVVLLIVTALVTVLIAVDVVAWAVGMTEIKPGAGGVTAYGVLMRAIFRCLMAIDFPIVQIWLGTFAGYCLTRKATKTEALPAIYGTAV